MKRYILIVLAITILISVVPAFAFPGYSQDKDDTIDGFASAYGWNKDYFDAATWRGKKDSSEEYGRLQGHQKENYEDIALADEWQAYELGLIDSPPTGFGTSSNGGLRMVAVALSQLNHDNWEDNLYGSVTGMSRNQPWCCSFISWCAEQCGFIESGTFRNTASCRNMSDYLIDTNGFKKYMFDEIVQFGGSEYSVVPGDVYIFYNPSDGCSHIALIAEASDTYFVTVEGLNWQPEGDPVRHGYVGKRTFSSSQLGSALDTTLGWVIHVEYPGMAFGDFDLSTMEGRAEACYVFITEEMGLSCAAACGIIGNLEVETGSINPLGHFYNPPHEDSYGIVQWNNNYHSWDDCIDFCNEMGMDYLSLEGQLYYMQAFVDASAQYGNRDGGRYGRAQAMIDIKSVPNTESGARSAAYTWDLRIEKSSGDARTIRQNNAAKWFNYFYTG